MKRVYTDPRFSGIEVHNDGDNRFRVYEITDGQRHEIDSFSTFSDHPKRLIPDSVAEKRARDYFERMASGHMNSELLDRPEIADTSATQSVQRPAQIPQEPFGLSASKDLDSLMGDNVLTADDVMAAYDQAKAMAEGPEKAKAMQQVKAMSQRLESSASELVRRLLG